MFMVIKTCVQQSTHAQTRQYVAIALCQLCREINEPAYDKLILRLFPFIKHAKTRRLVFSLSWRSCIFPRIDLSTSDLGDTLGLAHLPEEAFALIQGEQALEVLDLILDTCPQELLEEAHAHVWINLSRTQRAYEQLESELESLQQHWHMLVAGGSYDTQQFRIAEEEARQLRQRLDTQGAAAEATTELLSLIRRLIRRRMDPVARDVEKNVCAWYFDKISPAWS